MSNSGEQETLSTAQAAAELNLSRAQVLLLLEAGSIKATRVARHFRVDSKDLRRFRDQQRDARAALLNELAAADTDYLR